MARADLFAGLKPNMFLVLMAGVALFAVVSGMSPAIGQLTGRIPRATT